MERARTLARFWTWLPAFRVVAETEHLPTAATYLHVSPSALSRSIRMLEDELGQPLFRREGRRMRLNAAGEALLAALRDAMRLLDDALPVATGGTPAGPVRVSAAGATLPFVAPALAALRREHPHLLPHLVHAPPSEVNGLLLRGQLDLAVQTAALGHPQIRIVRIGALRASVYCGPSHPLAQDPAPGLEAVASYAFVAQGDGVDQPVIDCWPVDVPRPVAMTVCDVHVAMSICERGELLAVLPDALVRSAGPATHLQRIPLDVIPPVTVYAVRRRQLLAGDLAELVARAISNCIEVA